MQSSQNTQQPTTEFPGNAHCSTTTQPTSMVRLMDEMSENIQRTKALLSVVQTNFLTGCDSHHVLSEDLVADILWQAEINLGGLEDLVSKGWESHRETVGELQFIAEISQREY